MKKRLRFVLLLVVLATLGVVAVALRPQAQEMDDNEVSTVNESELSLYIKVYTAMQDDHDLTIDTAIQPYQITLDDFRQLERRIQGQPRLVERVRQALLDHAKEHSAFAQSLPTPTPKPAGHKSHRKAQ